MRLRRFAGLAVLVIAVLAAGGAVSPAANAQVIDEEVPILTSLTRLNPATEQGPTTLRIQYTATDADSDVVATALVTDPHGAWLSATATGTTGVLEFPLTTSSPAGLYYLNVVALEDGADPSNGAWWMSTGQVAHFREPSTGPTSHTFDFDAVDFTLTQAGPAPWVTTRLRGLTEDQATFVQDISTSGTSVGRSGDTIGTPVKWDIAGAPTNLPVPAGCSGTATAISDNGVILGALTCTEAPTARDMVWFPNGTSLSLPAGVAGEDVDNLGFVAGSKAGHAIAVRPDLTSKDLEDSTAASSVGRALTNYGYVVGDVSGLPGAGNANQIAVGWFADTVFPLWDPSVPSSAVDVNHLGYALIQIKTPGATRGALVGPNGFVVLLDDSGSDDRVVDLNYHGVVVGTRYAAGEGPVGVYYLGADTVLRIDSLVTAADRTIWGRYSEPAAVNDNGWVVGNMGGAAWLVQPPPF